MTEQNQEPNLSETETNKPENSVTVFLQEVEKPTIPAMREHDNPAIPSEPPPPHQPAPEPPPQYVPPADAPPVFDAGSFPLLDEPEKPAQTKPVFSEDYKKQTLRTYLEMEEGGTAWLCCQLTKTNDPSVFKYSEASKAMLLTALEPYKDVIVEALPAWVPILLIYMGLKADQVMSAMAIIKVNKQNAAGKQDAQKMQTIAKTVALEQQGERRNFVLYSDGYYRNDRAGQYIRDRTGEGKAKLEKPSMADLEKILAVKNNNYADLICAAFNIEEADFAKLGIKLTQE